MNASLEEREAADPGMGHVEWRRWESLKLALCWDRNYDGLSCAYVHDQIMGYATRIDGAWCFPALLCMKEGYGAPYRTFEALRRTLGLQYFVFLMERRL